MVENQNIEHIEWYQSRTIWMVIILLILAILILFQVPIPSEFYFLITATGLFTSRIAQKPIKPLFKK